MEITAQTTLRFQGVPEGSATVNVPASLDVAFDATAAQIPVRFVNTGESAVMVRLKALTSTDDARFTMPPDIEAVFAPAALPVGDEVVEAMLSIPLADGAAGAQGDVALDMVFEVANA